MTTTKNNMNGLSDTQRSRDGDAGSFLVGFLFGLFAGVFATVLLRSKTGKPLLSKLKKQWQKASDSMPEDISFKNWQEIIASVLDPLIPDEKATTKPKRRRKRTTRAKAAVKKLS